MWPKIWPLLCFMLVPRFPTLDIVVFPILDVPVFPIVVNHEFLIFVDNHDISILSENQGILMFGGYPRVPNIVG